MGFYHFISLLGEGINPDCLSTSEVFKDNRCLSRFHVEKPWLD